MRGISKQVRHAKSKWEWGTAPARSAERRDAASEPDPAKRAPGRKDTKRWCHGKEGAGHVAALVLTEDTPQARATACQWVVRWDWRKSHDWLVTWRCEHREACTACGKVLRGMEDLAVSECPVYPGTGEQRAAAEAELLKMRQRSTRISWRGKPVITGPQGYRRKRKVAG